ncbi:MAG: NADH-quinone oxidoreductase subunit L [Aigarchaeota archaeon]|nr:NADH-quinone oxidoreductase subunit L [Aigarchaeota archaeon]MDW8093132.1 NADH-quinone oxidoreductase subunit L [Nitrososphaerota archaeon]
MLPYAPWLAWLIPLVGSTFVPIAFRASKRIGELYSVLIAGSGSTFAVSMVTDAWGGRSLLISAPWIPLPAGRSVEFTLLIDPLSVLMASIATGIGTLILIYSIGYMAHEEGLPRYYFFMTFFIGGMALLVLADNLLVLYIGWEIVGLCSYALISFFYHKPEARLAGIKAFVTTRVGDVLLLSSVLITFVHFGSFSLTEVSRSIESAAARGTLDSGILTLILALAFGGAVGKSAQIPLHVWLPDAMEGPTPVSALIHAATMVKAGVYLVARYSYTLVPFEVVGRPYLSQWYDAVLIIGGLTAFLAATMGLVMNDIKRIIAYSTMSQLAIMFTALSVASSVGFFGGVFHLLSHSLFKALLFLAAGSVIHAVVTNNVDEMGGLRRYMPLTFATSLIGVLSLSGVPPFSGFFSKDVVLEALISSGNLYGILIIAATSILTIIYGFRWLSAVFLGEFRSKVVHHTNGGHKTSAPHESPRVMTVPLIILAALAAVAGLPPIEETFHEYMGIHDHIKVSPLTYATTGIILAVGLSVSYAFFISKIVSPAAVRERFSVLHRVVVNRYYMDHVYEMIFVRGLIGLSSVLRRYVEEGVIDRVNYAAARWFTSLVNVLRNIQTGSSNLNVSYIAIGIIILLVVLLLRLLGAL